MAQNTLRHLRLLFVFWPKAPYFLSFHLNIFKFLIFHQKDPKYSKFRYLGFKFWIYAIDSQFFGFSPKNFRRETQGCYFQNLSGSATPYCKLYFYRAGIKCTIGPTVLRVCIQPDSVYRRILLLAQ